MGRLAQEDHSCGSLGQVTGMLTVAPFYGSLKAKAFKYYMLQY